MTTVQPKVFQEDKEVQTERERERERCIMGGDVDRTNR